MKVLNFLPQKKIIAELKREMIFALMYLFMKIF